MKFKKNVSLKNYTTFRIGGPAKYFFVAKNKKNLIKSIKMAKKLKLPFFILGGGSNLLVSDKGFKGLVIKLQIANCKLQIDKFNVEAGVPLAKLVQISMKNGLTGLEWAIGIPGTVGGAIRGNAGAFGSSMADIVKNVEVFNSDDSRIKNYDLRNCKFDYRESIFKHANSATLGLRPRGMRMRPCEYPNLIILSAMLQLKKGKPKEIKKKIQENLNYRKEKQPLNFPSAGSVFKNPAGFFAGKLIDDCGLKGKKIGQAQISKKHANFIVNLGGAEAKDVVKLIKIAKQKVENKFGIVLEEEIQII